MDAVSLSRDQLFNAIHLVAMMSISDLSKKLNIPPTEMFQLFMESKTAARLYDEEAKFWWDGPAAAEEAFLKETGRK